MKKKVLIQRIRDLEHANRLMFDVLAALFEKQKPKFGHWPMFALRDGLTAEEADHLELFWRWAMRQDHNTVTKEALAEYYTAMMPPRLQGKLQAIAEAEIHDGMRVRIAKVALGLDSNVRAGLTVEPLAGLEGELRAGCRTVGGT